MSGREGRPFGEEQAEKKRQGEGCEFEEPKRQKVKDEGDSEDDATCNIGICLEKYFFNGNGLCADNPAPDEGRAIRGLCSYFISNVPRRSLRDDVGHLTPGVQATIQHLFSGSSQNPRALQSLCGTLRGSVPGSVLRPYLPRHQVQARIKDFLQSLDENTSPDDSISYVSGSRESPGDSMSYLPHFPDSSARGVDGGIFKAAEAFIRVWKVMDMYFDILTDDNGEGLNWRSTLFYMLRNCSPDYFKSELRVHMTIQDVAALLRCSPYSLGINEYGGGMVAGLIMIMKADPAKDQDNICGSCRYPIPDDLERVAPLHLRSIGAKNIIVVEQEEVFEELAVNCVFERTQSIIISAQVTQIQLQDLPVLVLVDGYGSAVFLRSVGLDILYTYKVLSMGKALNARRFVCDVKWLGLRGDVVEEIPRCLLNRKEIKIARRFDFIWNLGGGR
ncbi:hypothetical protein PTKIN_Ptkin11bG0144300 [Pterospermum kingtungense]